MNELQEKIFNVIKAIVQIDNFPAYYEDHAIRYGLLNYVAKYSLAKDKYLITRKAIDHLTKNNFLSDGRLRKGLKNRKNGFTYEHPVPSNIISTKIVEHRSDEAMLIKILEWTDKITVLTTEENTILTERGLTKDMPMNWRFFQDSQFARYNSSGICNEQDLIELPVYGQLKR